MGDDEDAAGVGLEVFFQPFDHGDVEMVGGVVEEEEVGLAAQGSGEVEAGLLAAGQGGDRAGEVVVGEAEAEGDAADVGPVAVAVVALEVFEVGGVGFHEAGKFAFVLFGGHAALGVFHAPLAVEDVAVGFLQVLVDGGLPGAGLLLDVADGGAGGEADLAFVGGFVADEAAHEGGFAGAVGADEADFFAGVVCAGDVGED